MKFVVPVSSHDVHMLNNWLDVILKFGGLANHAIHFIPSVQVIEETNNAAQRLNDNGIEAEVAPMEFVLNGGWPQTTNVMFFQATKNMSRQQSPWMWMELDCLPCRSNWADALSGAHSSSGARFMGSIVKTPWRDEETGKIVKSPDGDSDDMMCGCGIYPPNIGAIPALIPLLNDFMNSAAPAPVGFDIYLRYAIKQSGRAGTPLIDDKWNTGNYRIENGSVVCDPIGTHEGINPNQERTPLRSKVVSTQAATIHGCKDDSLHDLIMAGLDLSLMTPAAQSTERPPFAQMFNQPVPIQAPVDPKIQADLAALRQENMETKIMLKQLLEKMVGATDAPKPITDTTKIKTPLEKLVTLMSTSTKKIRLDQASEKLNVPINKLRAAVEADGSPIKLGKLGWLSFVEHVV